MAADTRAGPELILASASEGRARLLRDAGLSFRQQPAAVDERALEAEAARSGPSDPGELALLLARAKAEAVSTANPGALVIGADQVMDCAGRLYAKPSSIDAARTQLASLRGKTHRLNSALCVAQNGTARWQHLDCAHLTMRDFSDGFLDFYCRLEGEHILASVGAYRVEGLGIQLFSAIQGDHSTIIGLPLLALLGYLRDNGSLLA